ncbi:MAG: SH3 domain-containing protein [Eubacteriales bacterium]|nr:SH3 domain-containing protein [Eubacteriales bacterium]
MNFSKNHTFRNVLSLILVVLLMGTLFTGCKKNNEPDDTAGNNLNLNLSDNTTPSSDTQPQAPETEPTVYKENMATVTSQMNARSSPSMSASVVHTFEAGDRVEILMQETVIGVNWARVSISEDSSPLGWVVMDYVVMDNPTGSTGSGSNDTPDSTEPVASAPAESNTNTTNIKGVITGNGVNIRSEGSTTNGKILGSYNKGDVVTILETKDGWGRTDKGWVKMDYVNTTGTTTGTTNNTTTNNTTTTTTTTGNGSTTVIAKGIVIAQQLNIRSSATQDSDRLGSLNYGDRVEILEKSGNWGRTSKGWISLNYVYQDGTTGTNTAKGTVNANGGLIIRSGPGTGYDKVGAYADGESVSILEQFTYSGVKWGCTSKGWISMKYVDVEGASNDDDDETDYDEQLYGTVTAEGGLRIRSGAGSSYNVVGSLDYGDEVVILSRTIADDTTWGKISQGWICLDYVDLD